MTSCHVRPIPSHKHAGIFNCPLYWPRQLCPRHFADDQRLPFAERIRIGACSILFIISPTSYVLLDRSAFIRPFPSSSILSKLISIPTILTHWPSTCRRSVISSHSGPLFDIPLKPRIRHCIIDPLADHQSNRYLRSLSPSLQHLLYLPLL